MDEEREENRSEESSDEELLQREDKANDKQKKLLKCALCSKYYKNKMTLRQHMRSHEHKLKCEFCDKSYVRREDLRKHKKNIHEIRQDKKRKVFTCNTCNKTFDRKYNYTRHISRAHDSQFPCRHCDFVFQDYDNLFRHVSENHPINQQGGRVATRSHDLEIRDPFRDPGFNLDNNDKEAASEAVAGDHQSTERLENTRDESALQNAVRNRHIYPEQNEGYDVLRFFGNIREEVNLYLQERVREAGGIKWSLCVQVEMQRGDGQEATTATPYFRSRTYITLSLDNADEHHLNEAMQKMYASLEKFMREGSGWYVKKVLKLEIHTAVYKPLHGSTYIPLPKTLKLNNSILNIENRHDNKCFLYCLLAHLRPMATNPRHAEQYLMYEDDINMSGITYPVTLSQIRKVENQNENISINVFTFEEDTILPLRITEQRHRLHHVSLLLLTREEKRHYCLITNLNRFLSRTNRHTAQLYYCPYCLHGFYKNSLLLEHQQYCSRHEAQRIELPIPGKNDILEFKDYEKTLKVPFVIYADFETINSKIHTCSPNPNQSATTPTTKLEVCGFGYKVVCEDDRYTKPTVIYRGEDAGKKLIECLLQQQEEIREVLSTIEPMDIGEEHDDLIANATHCFLCKKEFTTYDKTYSRIVRHHNHLTGEIIGPACNGCNLNCKQADFIPVIFHNLKNFDAHILCETLGQFKDHRLRCIAQNTERYVSFSLGRLRFLDSFQFLPASLESLVDNLAQDGVQAFSHILSETDSRAEAELLLRKGVYPYEYMDSFEKFDESELPRKEQFYSTVKREHISNEDYEHARSVFRGFNMTCMGEYHDLYLKTDVLLLSDVFESFRNLCMTQYDLDPCHFYTSPGLSWSACLKMTGVRLELLSDIDKVLMMENGIRGGVSQISNRYQKANNSYLQDYDPSQPTTLLQYLDANNLYGWAMVQPLPVGDFVFMEKRDIESFDVMSVPENGNTGFILEVSLHYPKHLHDSHNCLPLAPVRQSISNEDLFPYAQYLLRKLNGLSEEDPLPNRGKVEKLLTTLEDKDRYVLHYRNLQLYLRLGMKIKSIHRILKFRQEAWMKPYIEHNTEMRKKAISTFQKNFYKLLNVSVFGKTMENVRHHQNIELIHTDTRLKKVTAKPTYKTTTIFNEDLVAAEMYRMRVNLFKPIFCGMCILDLSKYLMYDFWYNYIKKKYKNSAQLQMTDTDSVLFSCETEDLYRDMQSSMDYFDTSDYPKEHFLHSDLHKKTLGKMKNETNGEPIAEFVGLRSKMYSFVCNGKEEKRAKGIAKVAVKKDLKHDYYKDTLFDESSRISSMTSLRSHKHELFGENIQKKGLSSFDDKRYLIDAVRSYAYGHYKIRGDMNSEDDTPDQNEQNPCAVDFVNDQQWRMLSEQTFVIDDLTITPCAKL